MALTSARGVVPKLYLCPHNVEFSCIPDRLPEGETTSKSSSVPYRKIPRDHSALRTASTEPATGARSVGRQPGGDTEQTWETRLGRPGGHASLVARVQSGQSLRGAGPLVPKHRLSGARTGKTPAGGATELRPGNACSNKSPGRARVPEVAAAPPRSGFCGAWTQGGGSRLRVRRNRGREGGPAAPLCVSSAEDVPA